MSRQWRPHLTSLWASTEVETEVILSNSIFCCKLGHAKNFLAKILFYKKYFDFIRIFRINKKHFEIKFLKFLLEFDNFLLNKILAVIILACKMIDLFILF